MNKNKMSQAELEVMTVIWEYGDRITVNQVLEKLSNKKKWKYTTAATFLARLADKGFLVSCKDGAVNIYCAAISKEQYKEQETKEFIQSIHDGSEKSLIASLYRDKLSAAELEHLLEWLKAK